IAASRRELILADQAVKALEKLADKRKTAFQFEQFRKEAAAQEESWLAASQSSPTRRAA
ncbi:MAG: hypothetical protein JSS02_31710, partial [Planctomycetes bacterium]|nr:hypothetical protein [Planctomycetota bacterium]